MTHHAQIMNPGEWDPERHFYPRVLNATIHPMVKSFYNLGNERIINRYCHLHPETSKEKLTEMLNYTPAHFLWGGSDLFTVTNENSKRQMIVIETNSCPSGQKSTPCEDVDLQSGTGYHVLMEHSVRYVLEKKCTMSKKEGCLAVIYDKNEMEASGYASTLATITKEQVHMVQFHWYDEDPPVKVVDGVIHIRLADKSWIPVRAAYRYVTQKPWNRLPLSGKTLLFNPIVCCLAGGRNKMVASKAYDLLNMEMQPHGLRIRTPDTITDVNLNEIPLYVKSMGMVAVVKVPYSNAGQGVYTITNKAELDAFMAEEHIYDKFIIQSLVGNSKWSSRTNEGTYYHLGTVPTRKNRSYVFDLRMMVCGSDKGFRPVATYARRAPAPFVDELKDAKCSSWEMLGTNLSVKDGRSWTSDTSRLYLMDSKDFNTLGIGLDDLIDGYVQTVLSVVAIDKVCKRLMKDGTFNTELFSSLNQDDALLQELFQG